MNMWKRERERDGDLDGITVASKMSKWRDTMDDKNREELWMLYIEKERARAREKKLTQEKPNIKIRIA